MIADIVVGLMILVCVLLGWRIGFLRGILGFVSSLVCAVISILLARPLASVLDSWFGWADQLGGLFTGEGALESWASRQGFLFLILICAVAIFIALRLTIFILRKKILRLKEASKAFDRLDKLLGLALGVVKFVLLACVLSTLIAILSSMEMFPGIHESIFEGSVLAAWVYDVSIMIIAPLMLALNAEVLEKIINNVPRGTS